MEREERRFTPAITVIIIFGIISMLGDMVYETARGANGQYLSLIGRNAAEVGVIFGIGEFIGYFLRIISGVFSDRLKNPWPFVFIGYGSLIVIPLMGFSTHMGVLGALIIMERIGKALRSPAKDTILSSIAEGEVGTGFAFGLQEFLDQLGAFSGPLIFTLVFYQMGGSGLKEYMTGYKALIIPYIILMMFLYYSYRKIKREYLIERLVTKEFRSENLRRTFWLYTLFTFFATAGFLNFPIIAIHIKKFEIIPEARITTMYAVAMAVDAIAALIVGKLYDGLKERSGTKSGGIRVLAAVPFLTAAMTFIALQRDSSQVLPSMVLFGIIMGLHETVMRSAIADITPFSKRGTGYGVFNTVYGLALLLGSAVAGFLYEGMRTEGIMIFTGVMEVAAIIIYLLLTAEIGKNHDTMENQYNSL